jgi:hypothetical protein
MRGTKNSEKDKNKKIGGEEEKKKKTTNPAKTDLQKKTKLFFTMVLGRIDL